MGSWIFGLFLLLSTEFFVKGVNDSDGECPERLPKEQHGRDCTKSCQLDSDCVGSQLECKCDGFCGLSCISKNKNDADEECPERLPKDVNHRDCRKNCEVDSDCPSPNTECKCDGICGQSCIRKNMRCYNLKQTIANGQVEITPNNSFKALARYDCDDGYAIRGVPVRICQGDETWSGDEPECVLGINLEEATCGPPTPVPHAYHDGLYGQERFVQGTKLQFRCMAGYNLQPDGIEDAWCMVGGEWLGPNMTCAHAGCPFLPKIPNGWVEIDLRRGSWGVAIYRCEDGFFLTGQNERKCLPIGKWDGLEPSCVKVSCSFPPKVKHAHYDGPVGQSYYLPGYELVYTCNHGYYSIGHPRIECNIHGKWIGQSFSCSPLLCGDPSSVENGYIRITGEHFGDNVTYHCKNGYELVGSAIRTCDENGIWTGTPAKCIALKCPNIPAPPFARVWGTGNTYGSILYFECDSGHKLIGSSQRMCLTNRTWSGIKTKCEEINCGWPGPFMNGHLNGLTTTLGSKINFHCIVRTKFQEGGHLFAICQEDGTWSAPPPVCLGQCRVPSLDNASFRNAREFTWLDHDTILEYTCRNGLIKRTSAQVRCNNGTWSPRPECIPSHCFKPPPHVYNGMRIYFGQDHRNRAKYVCFPGYKLVGMTSKFLICNYGKWTGGIPMCKEDYCKNPGELINGTIFKKGILGKFIFKKYIRTIPHGSRLVYECKRGFRLVGPSGATCVNGKWQPNLKKPGTKCEEAKHPPTVRLWIPMQEMNTIS